MRSDGRPFQTIHLFEIKVGRIVLNALEKISLRFPEAHGANQSLPLKPAKPKNAEQPTRDRCRLRNDRAANLNVIQLELKVAAIGLSIGEQQSQGQIVYVRSGSGSDG